MRQFFAPNIDRKGRMVRGVLALALLAGAAFSFSESVWLCTLLAIMGVFVMFEALWGWCAARACGIKTRF